MTAAEGFFDSNVLLYLLSADTAKANLAEDLLVRGGNISVQVLNEFASVAIRKFGLSPAEVREVLEPIRAICRVHPLTTATHDRGLDYAERFKLSVYDGMIVAAAMAAECSVLFSEDMQDGLVIESKLRICNPFAIAPSRQDNTAGQPGNLS